MTVLRMHVGALCRIRRDGETASWRVRSREKGGYMLQPVLGGDPKTFSHDEIGDLRLDDDFEYLQIDPDNLDPELRELLTRAFESHDPKHRITALVRAEVCRRIDELLNDAEEPLGIAEACAAAVGEVYSGPHVANLRQDLERIRGAEEHRRLKWAKPGRMAKVRTVGDKPGAPPRLPPHEIREVHPAVARRHYERWLAGGRDTRVLIPLFTKRGDRKPRKHPEFVRLLDAFLKEKINQTRGNTHAIWKAFCKVAKKHEFGEDVPELERTISRKGLEKYIERSLTTLELDTRHFDRKTAKRLNRTAQTRPLPDYAMQELEIDHCLLDVIVLDDGTRRPIGRPWLTAAIDRATKMIVGVHLSFEPPSYASVQRCLVHAFWPKDLRGMGTTASWPCQGVPTCVIADRGSDYMSFSLRRAEKDLGFALINLPPRSPWLKGTVERLFKRLNIAVFSLTDGKTFLNAVEKGDYKPVPSATSTLSEIRRELLHWIVDDYHVTFHQGLMGIPLERWHLRQPPDGLRFVPSLERMNQLLGELLPDRPIGTRGVAAFSTYYRSPEADALYAANRHRRYLLRFDPYDLSVIWLLTPKGNWIELEPEHPEITVGYTRHQNAIALKAARRDTPEGLPVPIGKIHEMLLQANGEAAARLMSDQEGLVGKDVGRWATDNGRFFTRVYRDAEERSGSPLRHTRVEEAMAAAAAEGAEGPAVPPRDPVREAEARAEDGARAQAAVIDYALQAAQRMAERNDARRAAR